MRRSFFLHRASVAAAVMLTAIGAAVAFARRPRARTCDEIVRSGDLERATQLVLDGHIRPADRAPAAHAASLLKRLTAEDAQCAPAWAGLASAAFQAAYEPCGTGDFTEAENAIDRGLALATDREARRSLERTLGQVRASQWNWKEAKAVLREAGAIRSDRETTRWLSDIDMRQAPTPDLLDALGAIFAGQLVANAAALSVSEIEWALQAVAARHGRQTNEAATDAVFFCDQGPLSPHATVSADYRLDEESHSTVDEENLSILRAAKAGVRVAAKPGRTSQSPPEAPVVDSAEGGGAVPPEPPEELAADDSQAPPDLEAPDAPPAPIGDIETSEFREILAPYGTWMSLADGQSVWRPSTAEVGWDFTPYVTDGQWVSTDEGWAFESSYAWGWAAFHYGNWSQDSAAGWVWTPSQFWAPAWVEWRFGDNYVAWRPTPPSATQATTTVQTASAQATTSVQSANGGQPVTGRLPWSVIHPSDMSSPRLQSALLDSADAETMIPHMKPAPIRHRANHWYCVGPPARFLAAAGVQERRVPVKSLARIVPPSTVATTAPTVQSDHAYALAQERARQEAAAARQAAEQRQQAEAARLAAEERAEAARLERLASAETSETATSSPSEPEAVVQRDEPHHRHSAEHPQPASVAPARPLIWARSPASGLGGRTRY